MREKIRPKITVNEKVLLYLREFSKLKDYSVSPFEITQPGIAESVGIRVNHVPRAIKQLKKLGYVEDLITHVRGSTKKRKVHFLTESGMAQAESLKRKIESLYITLIATEKAPVEVKISEVNSLLDDNLRFFDIINNISPDGVFDYTRFEIAPKKIIAKKKRMIAEYIGKMPTPTPFLNRNNEISRLKKWVESDAYGLMILEGAPGIGKTALISKVARENFPNTDIFWYAFGEGSDTRSIIECMSDFFHKIGRESLKIFVDSSGTSDIKKCASISLQDLVETNVLLVFDGFDDVSDDVKNLILMILDSLDEELHSSVKFVITTRELGRMSEKKESLPDTSILRFQIRGLDEATAREFENLKGLGEIEFKRIYQLTEGNPRLLQRITSQLEDDKEVEQNYSPDELAIMRYLRTFKKE